MIVWLDGELVPIEAARVSPLDRGLTVGDGVFETLRVYSGTPFAFTRHYERLATSARALGIEPPSYDVVRKAGHAVLDANKLSDARLRITVTAGEGPPGSSRVPASPTIVVVVVPFTPAAPTAEAVVCPWTRNEHSATAGLKTLSYAANVRALAYAEARGASEALFANTSGNLCEATGSNVFAVFDGELVTPPPSAGCLLGVTRGIVLDVARDAGMRVDERDVPIDALARADEAFLSSSTREVQAITKLDGKALPAAPGPVSTQVANLFRDLVARDLNP
ncbi:MAG TPA: aminotransferase class IV [Acidimicrobiia bacterium]|jgi:branched-chain amino acid aminotransferase